MTAASIFLQIVIAWLYGHVLEYCAHRYLLHNHKNFKGFFKNHFGTHHKISRKNEMYDSNYESLASSKFEMLSILFAIAIHLPVYFVFPFSYMTLLVSVAAYYFLHRKAHTDVEWGMRWMPWHYEHHMGKNQHLNWGVRLPFVDILLGTNTKKQEEVR